MIIFLFVTQGYEQLVDLLILTAMETVIARTGALAVTIITTPTTTPHTITSDEGEELRTVVIVDRVGDSCSTC